MLVIISVESQAREWESQTILAAELAKFGCTVLVADDQFLMRNIAKIASHTEEEILLIDKSASISCLPKRIIPLLNSNKKSSAVVLFQEGWLADPAPTPVIQLYTAQDASKYVEKFFVFGMDQARKLDQTNESLSSRIRLTGSPRFDLPLSFRDAYTVRRAAISELIGEYSLITDPFVSAPQSGRWMDALVPPLWHADPRNKGQLKKFLEKYVSQTEQASRLFIDYSKRLITSNPEMFFVYRAHPGSSESTARETFKGLSNVRIDKSFSSDLWIASARFVFTHVCTTALQTQLWSSDSLKIFDFDHPYLLGLLGSLLKEISQHKAAVDNPCSVNLADPELLSNVGYAHKVIAKEILDSSRSDRDYSEPMKILAVIEKLREVDVIKFGPAPSWKWGQLEPMTDPLLKKYCSINEAKLGQRVLSNSVMLMWSIK